MSLLALSVVLVLLVPLASTDGGSPLKIFVLAGQSNMVGMASIDHLDILINCSCPYNEYRDTLWNGTAYKAKSNVYMKYDDHHGPLTVGRDTGYAGSHRFGPELMFGWQVGDAMRYDDILLIKTAWGGTFSGAIAIVYEQVHASSTHRAWSAHLRQDACGGLSSTTLGGGQLFKHQTRPLWMALSSNDHGRSRYT